jgi:bromodomain-containing factor 1
MAVMTSLPSDGVELEPKTQPVPSSDKMALDLEING